MSNNEEVIVNERRRSYNWVLGKAERYVNFHDVVGVRVSESGNHYLRQKNGDLTIVRPTWDYIEIIPETEDTGWTF